jgi:hypothetical protein
MATTIAADGVQAISNGASGYIRFFARCGDQGTWRILEEDTELRRNLRKNTLPAAKSI